MYRALWDRRYLVSLLYVSAIGDTFFVQWLILEAPSWSIAMAFANDSFSLWCLSFIQPDEIIACFKFNDDFWMFIYNAYKQYRNHCIFYLIFCLTNAPLSILMVGNPILVSQNIDVETNSHLRCSIMKTIFKGTPRQTELTSLHLTANTQDHSTKPDYRWILKSLEN